MTGSSTLTSRFGLSSSNEGVLETTEDSATSPTLEVGNQQFSVGTGEDTAALRTTPHARQDTTFNEIPGILRAQGNEARLPSLEGEDEFFEPEVLEDLAKDLPSASEAGGTPAASKAVALGSGQMSAQLRAESQAQQPGWAERIYSGIAGTLGRTLEYCDQVMANAGPGAQKPGAPVHSDASEAAVVEARKITRDIEDKLAQLYLALIDSYQLPQLAVRHTGDEGLIRGNPVEAGDRSILRIRAMATLREIGRAAGSMALAATLPAAAAEPSTGLIARLFAFLGGVVMGARTISNMPENANLLAAATHINEVMNEVDAMLDKLNALKRQERMRETSTSRALLISLERDDHIRALDRQIEQLQTALATAGDVPDGAKVGQSRPVALGHGEARALMLERMNASSSLFGAFFSLLGRAFSSLGSFAAGLPSFFFGDSARRESERSEQAYSINYRDALNTLSSQAANSQIDPITDAVILLETRGLSRSQILIGHAEAGRQLCRGENLHSLITGGTDLVLAKVAVGEGATTYVVPSHVALVRDLASYLTVMAGKAAQEVDLPVARIDEDGAVFAADPTGKLFNFLMSVPTAYTANMVGHPSGQSGVMTIDHHGAGFPGGARSMQFNRVFRQDENGQMVLDREGNPIAEVRLRFLARQPNPVFTPLAGELKRLTDFMVVRSIAANQARRAAEAGAENAHAARVLAGFEVTELQQILHELIEERQAVGVLLAADQEQIKALKNWKGPTI